MAKKEYSGERDSLERALDAFDDQVVKPGFMLREALIRVLDEWAWDRQIPMYGSNGLCHPRCREEILIDGGCPRCGRVQ